MVLVCFILLGFTLILSQKQACIRQAVEFDPHRIGGFIKFLGKGPQIPRVGMREKLQEKFNPGFGSNERV